MNILGAAFIFMLSVGVSLGRFLQTSEVQAFLGNSTILPCNGSGFPVEELRVQWEALGKGVISRFGDNVTVGEAFEGRVEFLSDPAESQDFSIVLSDVMLNDGEIYECLWEEKPICSVTLTVLPEPDLFDYYLEVLEGTDVILECFGNIPKYKPWEEMFIQWLKDDREILRLSSGKMDVRDGNRMILAPEHAISRGIFSLIIKSVSVLDQGVYQCRYKSTDYGEPQIGYPEAHTLTVNALFSEMTELTVSIASSTSLTHTSTSVPTWTAVASTQTEADHTAPAHTYAASARAEVNSSVPTHTYAASTQTEAGHTAPAHTYAERDEDTPAVPEAGTISGRRDPLEFLSDEQIPWIRIGLISGVLLVTAVVMGLMLLFGRI